VDNSHADSRCNPIQFVTQRRLGKHGQNSADVGDRHRPTVPVQGRAPPIARQDLWTIFGLCTNRRRRSS